MRLLSGIKFVVYSAGVVCAEYLKYKYRRWSLRAFSRSVDQQNQESECYNAMIKSIGTKFAATNIYYIKMFQALAYSADFAANDELVAYFRDYTDNVVFTESEYSVSELTDLSKYAKTVGYELSFSGGGESDPIVPAKSGSISLVFYGTICKLNQSPSPSPTPTPTPTPTPIVVKYLRANMRERVMKSIDDFKYLVWCLNKIPSLRYLHLNDIYNEQRVLMMDQLDFAKEAACIGEVYENCKEMRCVTVPVAYPEFTAKFPNIIVMERIMGKTLDQLENGVKDHYCHILARGLVKTVFIDGLYHCDLHPGNVLFIEEDGDRDDTSKYRIGLLDFGIIGRLTVDEQEITYQVFHSILNKDADRAIAIIMESYTEPVDVSRECNRDEPEMMGALRHYMREMMETVVTCFSAENLCFINKQLIKNNLKIARSFTKFELSLSVCDNLCKKLAVNRSYLNHLTEIITDVFE